MTQVTNPLQACSDIFFKPNGVFAATNVNHNWSWFPFVFVISLGLLPAYMYFNYVDFDWYRELIINMAYADISPNQQATIRDNMTSSNVSMFSMFGVILSFIVINCILAVYLNLATKSDEENLHGFTDWFGFTWWISMPSIVSAVLSLLVIATADTHQLDPVSLSPTSLAYWGNVEMSSAWFSLAQALRIENLWSMYFMAVGITQWTRIRGNKAYLIAVAPYVMIWGIWTLIIAIQ